jgi:hypothetical protein
MRLSWGNTETTRNHYRTSTKSNLNHQMQRTLTKASEVALLLLLLLLLLLCILFNSLALGKTIQILSRSSQGGVGCSAII